MKKIKKYTIIFCLQALQLFLLLLDAEANCRNLIPKVKQATEYYLGISYPWYYNLGQIEAETNCMWKTSLDGLGSIGYAQLTPKYLPWLREFPNWNMKDHIDHFYAQAYLIKQLLNQAYCKQLWNVYQCYNRSCFKVNREAKEAFCIWENAYTICNQKYCQMICVWKAQNKCLQWRTNCDINYNYGFKVWKYGIKYREGIIENVYKYW
jgi:hypothetical protein